LHYSANIPAARRRYLAAARRRLGLVPLAACLLAGPAPAANEALDAAFARSSIVIEASVNACYRFAIYLAEQPAQRSRGLMYVRELDDMTGMLFVYPDEAMHSMWMKNTYLPLDMLFIRGDGRISSIVADTEPRSLTSIPSREPVRFVLELKAGVSARFAIRPGDTLLWAGDAIGMPSEH